MSEAQEPAPAGVGSGARRQMEEHGSAAEEDSAVQEPQPRADGVRWPLSAGSAQGLAPDRQWKRELRQAWGVEPLPKRTRCSAEGPSREAESRLRARTRQAGAAGAWPDGSSTRQAAELTRGEAGASRTWQLRAGAGEEDALGGYLGGGGKGDQVWLSARASEAGPREQEGTWARRVA